MICPYCDSRVREVPDNRCCPNCGGPLGHCISDDSPEKRDLPEPPLGIYSGNDCWLEIGKDSVRIRKEKIAFIQNTDYEIGYDELTGVVHQPAEGESFGYLCLRCTLNQKTPFPASWLAGVSDPTTIVFKKGANAVFEKAYTFLRSCLDADYIKPPALEPSFPEPPVGVYKGRLGTLEITENAVCFVRKFPMELQTEYRIPYKDLTAVAAKNPTWWRYGELNVRCWQNRRMGFEKNSSDIEMSIVLNRSTEGEFRKLYEFLKECARIANGARCAQEEEV